MTIIVNTADLDDIHREQSPFESLKNTVVFSSADWTAAPDMAWVYGIVIGWDDEDDPNGLDAVARQFGWKPEKIERLRRLHAAFDAAAATPARIEQILAELGGHAKDCDALPDPDADGPGAWDETFRERAAGRAYRHAQDIVRRIAGVTA